MNIDFNVTDILPSRWWDLTQDVLRDKKFYEEEFRSLFKETFEVMRYCVCEETVNKGLIEPIKEVSGFIATRFVKADYNHLAACELADAMLANCLQSEIQDEPIRNGRWMILTTEIEINFLDVDMMLFNFAQNLAWADGC